MDLLFSNYPPMRTKMESFADKFYSLIPMTKKLDIAVGYITSDALIELKKATELNAIEQVNLIIGMHYWDKFTETEYRTALDLNRYLRESRRGEVRLVTPFRFHGKLYSYSNEDGPFAGIIGSNNLSSIVDGGTRIYEASAIVTESAFNHKLSSFIRELRETSTENIANMDIHQFKQANKLLENHDYVEQIEVATLAEYMMQATDTTFNIPIKGYEVSPQSNLNVFFGKGREARNGLVKPRHWYEVELIVPRAVTVEPGYPQAKTDDAVFDVVTDDGWKFKCKVSGDYSKNFRSENDLKILGRWLKGRLENAGVLNVGEPVTQDTLRRYGRSTFSLTKTRTPNLWILDFGVR